MTTPCQAVIAAEVLHRAGLDATKGEGIKSGNFWI
jgi:hypothetical protein